LPRSANSFARVVVVVVFDTPPRWLETTILRLMLALFPMFLEVAVLPMASTCGNCFRGHASARATLQLQGGAEAYASRSQGPTPPRKSADCRICVPFCVETSLNECYSMGSLNASTKYKPMTGCPFFVNSADNRELETREKTSSSLASLSALSFFA
jgi:hypothetical protein